MITLHAGDAEAVVDPTGGRLRSLRVGTFDLLTDAGSFVMAPWAGRTGHGRFEFEGVEHHLPVAPKHAPHAIHGPVRSRPWTVEESSGASMRLHTALGPEWPWAGRCEQRITLHHDRIELWLSVHSVAHRFPAVAGWHPWFAKPASVHLDAAALLERGADRLPTGRRIAPPPATGPFDDCFEGIRWPAVLVWEGGPEVRIEAKGCDHCVLYDEPADATCVEPQTGPPNGLVTGEAAVVAPDSPLEASTVWSWA